MNPNVPCIGRRPEPCEPRRCRCRPAVAALMVAFAVAMAAATFGCMAYLDLSDRLAAVEQLAAMPGFDPSGINARIDELKHETHLRRKDLSDAFDRKLDELRREIAAAVESEAAARVREDDTLGRTLARAVADLAKADAKLIKDDARAKERGDLAFRMIADLAGKVTALEGRPTPERVVVERRVEVQTPVYYGYPVMMRQCR